MASALHLLRQAPLRLLLLLAVGALGNLAGWTHCQAQVSENQVKAAFLFKFGSYVEWPAQAFASPDSPLDIGIVGDRQVAAALRRIAAGRTIGGHPVAVRRLRRGDPVAGLHMLFVASSERDALPAWLAALKDQPALVVTEADGALPVGSMINFVVVDDKLRFDIALDPVESCKLKISARLLAVARKVIARAS